MLESAGSPAVQPGSVWAPRPVPFLVLGGALALTLMLSSGLLGGRWPAPEAAWRAAAAVALAFGLNRLTARLALPLLQDGARTDAAAALRYSAAVLWAAPLMSLARQHEALILPGTLAAAFAAARTVRKAVGSEEGGPENEPWRPRRFLSPDAEPPESSASLLPRTSALLAHLGLFCAAAGWTVAGALLAAAAAWMAGWIPAPLPQPARDGLWKARGVALASALAAVTVAFAAIVERPAVESAPAGRAARAAAGAGRFSDPQLHSGVVLIAPAPRNTRLPAPAPAASRPPGNWLPARTPPRREIPFTGVYWIFPAGLPQPPASSWIVRDSPLNYRFESVDRTALVMQAVQELPWPVDPRCCRALEVAVMNADRIAGSLALEVWLIAGSGRERRRASLGIQPVARAGRAMLRFPMRSGSVPAGFHRIVVDFHLAGRRIHQSAQAAIEQFRLVP